MRLLARALRWFALGCLAGLFVLMLDEWQWRIFVRSCHTSVSDTTRRE